MPVEYVSGDDHVVTITINRPEARNSMDMEHFYQLRCAWDRFAEDDDAFGEQSRQYKNVDNITWECDYPHSDSTWPQAPEALMKYLEGVSDEDIDKITHLNAMKHFHFDPFSVRPREQCTVGALRAEAADVDTSLVSRARGQTKINDQGIVSVSSFTNRIGQTND